MKSLIILGLLLTALVMFPGCYTIVFVGPAGEDVSFNPDTNTPFDPDPWPVPAPPPDPGPQPPPHCPQSPIQVIVVNNPPSTPPSSDDRRQIQTGRGPIVSNPVQPRNDENNRPTRDSGERRSGR